LAALCGREQADTNKTPPLNLVMRDRRRNMSLDDTWYTEIYADHGAALSLKIKDKVHEERSAFQHIEIYETETFGTLMSIDGCLMLTDRDNFIYHEMMSHPVLFTHRQPKNVVVIGGGDCGTLREVLRHQSVQNAWQVEIDERVTRVAEQYFPELCEANNDPRARLVFADGIKWVADAAPGSLDVIIVDSTDPVGPAKGLFSEEFFRSCQRALASDGIMVQQSESPLLHLPLLQEVHGAMRGAGFPEVLTLHFAQFCYPSGWWSCTMAGKGAPLTHFREADAVAKTFKTKYYSAQVHRAAMALPPFAAEALGQNT
jgi:spermidine synthase